MNKEETKEAIKVMRAFVDGKQIEFASRGCNNDYWAESASPFIAWNWPECNYRIAETKPVEIEVGMVVTCANHNYTIEKIVGYEVCLHGLNGLFIISIKNLVTDHCFISNGKVHELTAPEAK